MANKNRCSGCTHYDGFYKDNVRCAIGQKSTIDRGCGNFSPDSTANCHECYYNENGTRAYDITCRINGSIKGQRDHCNDYAERWDSNPQQNKNSGCFISTVACKYKGLPDDCIELQLLRTFRDDWLCNTLAGEALIDEYYREAPFIALNLNEARDLEYAWRSIELCIKHINNNDHERALFQYQLMFDELRKRIHHK